MSKAQTFSADNLRILKPDEMAFSLSDSGYLNMSLDNKSYSEVSLTRLVPFYERERYISVSYQDDDKEWHELGIIKSIIELSDKQRQICDDYLKFRYFVPKITKISTITDNRMGYLFIEAETTAGNKKIAVNDWWTNFKLINNKMLSVTDADGNRYYVPEVAKMDKKSYKKLQLFI